VFQFLKNSDLFKTTIKNSIQVFVRFVIGILQIKIVATFVGPSGMAMVSQLQNSLQIGLNFSSLGFNNGVVKYLSHYHYSQSRKQLIISTSLLAVTTISLFLGLIIFIFPDFFVLHVFNSREYIDVVKYSGVHLFVMSLLNLFLSILNGTKQLRYFVFLNVFASLTGFVVVFIAVYYFKLLGLLWVQNLYGIIAFILVVFLFRKMYSKLKLTFSLVVLKRLSNYSLMAIVSGVLSPLTFIVIRNAIVKHTSLDDAGLWDGANKISTNYIMLASMSFSYYFLPTFSSLTSSIAIRHEVKKAFKLIIPLLILGGLVFFLTRQLMVDLLFSVEFTGMVPLLKWQIIGDGFKVLSWVLGVLLIAKEKTSFYIGTEFVSVGLQIAFVYLLVPLMGIEGSTLAYCLENVIYFAVLCVLYYYIWGRSDG